MILPMDHIPKEQLGWIAGIMDGEGCISITRSRTNCYRVCIVVGNSDKRMIEALAVRTKMGSIYSKCIREGHKPLYQWGITNTFVPYIITFSCKERGS